MNIHVIVALSIVLGAVLAGISYQHKIRKLKAETALCNEIALYGSAGTPITAYVPVSERYGYSSALSPAVADLQVFEAKKALEAQFNKKLAEMQAKIDELTPPPPPEPIYAFKVFVKGEKDYTEVRAENCHFDEKARVAVFLKGNYPTDAFCDVVRVSKGDQVN